MVRTTARRTVALAAALSTGLILVACGSGDSPEGNTGGEEQTTVEKTANKQVLRPPNFTHNEDRLAGMEAEGCGAAFEEWAFDTIVYFTEINGGDWEGVDIDFAAGQPSSRGAKTCDITVSGAGMMGTPGGDLNDFTITAMGLTSESNPVDMRRSDEIGEAIRDAAVFAEVDGISGLSPLVDDAVGYATAKGLTDHHIEVHAGQPSTLRAVFTNGTTTLVTHAPIKFYMEGAGTDTVGTRGGWAAVTTDDPQTETEMEARTAAGRMAQVFTMGMNNTAGAGNEAVYTIRYQ